MFAGAPLPQSATTGRAPCQTSRRSTFCKSVRNRTIASLSPCSGSNPETTPDASTSCRPQCRAKRRTGRRPPLGDDTPPYRRCTSAAAHRHLQNGSRSIGDQQARRPQCCSKLYKISQSPFVLGCPCRVDTSCCNEWTSRLDSRPHQECPHRSCTNSPGDHMPRPWCKCGAGDPVGPRSRTHSIWCESNPDSNGSATPWRSPKGHCT